jgi:hypothetical protein
MHADVPRMTIRRVTKPGTCTCNLGMPWTLQAVARGRGSTDGGRGSMDCWLPPHLVLQDVVLEARLPLLAEDSHGLGVASRQAIRGPNPVPVGDHG